jgi:N-acyl-D-amino-acid deacylase
VVGKTIVQLAKDEQQDPLDVALHLILISEGHATGVFHDQSEDNVRALLRHPSVVVGSDGSALAPHGVLCQQRLNPRAYGTFPRVLGRYVRKDRVLSLESAVRKMTSLTAERFGLADRGVIRVGACADIVVFDAENVIDRATFTDPCRYPEGIRYVLVNGVVVVEQGRRTGALPGQVL